MTRDQEIAWLAGILEGEAHFGIDRPASLNRKKRRSTLRICLGMTDRDIIEKVLATLGIDGHIGVYDPSISPSAKARQAFLQSSKTLQLNYRITISGENAETVMKLILPYMGKRRTNCILGLLNTDNLSHRPVFHDCLGCGKRFSRTGAGALNSKYCSQKCGKKSRRKNG